ncbi:MAG: arginine repressor [bacterium]|nr:arginine repressor [bacterium]
MKVGRQSKIIELISKYDVETQEELADRLNAAGYNVTQATISRDIRELKLTKVATNGGRQKYIVLQTQESGLYDKYVRVLRDGYISMDMAMNIIVIKTVPGMAMAVAAALDHLNINGIVGCIAGDDTIMCAIKSLEDTEIVMEKVTKLVNSRK